MGFIYSFVDLDEEQKHRRRQLLDNYGFTAQLSVVAPLLVIQLYFLATWAQARSRHNAGLKPPSSPVRKSTQSRHHVESLSANIRKFIWWCGDHVVLQGIELGTKGEILGALAWTTWLLVLSFLQTGDGQLIWLC